MVTGSGGTRTTFLLALLSRGLLRKWGGEVDGGGARGVA